MRRPVTGATWRVASATASRTAVSWKMPASAMPRRLGFADHGDDDVAVLGVERGGRLVEQQDRVAADEAAGEVDPLLLAAGEGGGRQRVQAVRDVEAEQQRLGFGAGLVRRRPRAMAASATMSRAGTRGTTRRNWLT